MGAIYLLKFIFVCLFFWECLWRVTEESPVSECQPGWTHNQMDYVCQYLTFENACSLNHFNIFDAFKRSEKDLMNKQSSPWLSCCSYLWASQSVEGVIESQGANSTQIAPESTLSEKWEKIEVWKELSCFLTDFSEIWIMFIFSREANSTTAHFILGWLSIWAYQSITLHSLWLSEMAWFLC